MPHTSTQSSGLHIETDITRDLGLASAGVAQPFTNPAEGDAHVVAHFVKVDPH